MKKEKLLFILAGILFVLAILFAIFDVGINRVGEIKTEQREVSEFNKIHLSVPAKLKIKQGDTESLKIKAGEKTLKNIKIEVKDNILIIEQEKPLFWFGFWRKEREIILYANVKDLKEIKVLGSGSVESGLLKTRDLNITIQGSGKIKTKLHARSLKSTIMGTGILDLQGTAIDQSLFISGSGKYHAEKLRSRNASVDISGSGDVLVNTKESLKINISGSGKVLYLGNPEISQTISGSGKIKKVEK